jgi:hypothetical protein
MTNGEVHLYQTLDDTLTVIPWTGSDYEDSSWEYSQSHSTSEANTMTSCLYDLECVSLSDPAHALTIIDAALANPHTDQSAYFGMALHYYRALVLETLNRPDDALTEYVTVYKTYPASAWGKLAALHLTK